MTVFQASHPHAFLDYFRIPYEVSRDAVPVPAALTFLGRLRTSPPGAEGARELLWLRADARAQLGRACLGGRYRLGDSLLAAHVLPDSSTVSWLPRVGTGWRPIEPIQDEQGGHVASVWRSENGDVFLPFDMAEVMTNFWSERYRSVGRRPGGAATMAVLRRGYYVARPAIPRPAQLLLRRGFTRVQQQATFPRWPVEDSLHDLYAWQMSLLAELRGGPVPWLATWPGGRSWAFVLTHDVESEFGWRNLHLLRDPERAAGLRSSWNFVPQRYELDESVVQRLRDEGCEIGVHGLRHDGRDLGSRRLFEQRLPRIRAYAERWQAVGFRSPATQRVWDWMPETGFDYDSSFTDTDPYEPQPGGCCSYLPFLNRDQVELPITLPQDHTLFAILRRTADDVWVAKARHVRERGGMALVLAHPDYATDPHLRDAWQRLLDEFRDDGSAWHALPREVANWWRRRASSTLRPSGREWRIEGPAADDGQITFTAPVTPTTSVGSATASARFRPEDQ